MAIEKVGVVGLGTMGAGIAQLCIEAGVETVARDVTDAILVRHEAIDLDASRVGPEDARENLDRRGLSGPVEADERMDLTRHDLDGGFVQGLDPRKGLGDPPDRQARRHRLEPITGHARRSLVWGNHGRCLLPLPHGTG